MILLGSMIFEIANQKVGTQNRPFIIAEMSCNHNNNINKALEIVEAAAKADLYFGYGVPAELLESAPGLRWVHSGAAGVGSSLTSPMLESDVIFTN